MGRDADVHVGRHVSIRLKAQMRRALLGEEIALVGFGQLQPQPIGPDTAAARTL